MGILEGREIGLESGSHEAMEEIEGFYKNMSKYLGFGHGRATRDKI